MKSTYWSAFRDYSFVYMVIEFNKELNGVIWFKQLILLTFLWYYVLCLEYWHSPLHPQHGMQTWPSLQQMQAVCIPRLASTIVKDSAAFPWKYWIGNQLRAWLTLVSCDPSPIFQSILSKPQHVITPFIALDGKTTPLAFHLAIRVIAMSVVNCLILSYDEDMPIKWYQSSKFFPLKSYILIPIYIGKGCSLVLSCLRTSDFPYLW